MNAGADLFSSLEEPAHQLEQKHIEAEPHVRAIASIERVLRSGHAIQVAWSSGKDSSSVMNLVFTAAINLIEGGSPCPPIHVAHSDTGVENPVVRALADTELKKMRVFAKAHRIPFHQHIGRPMLSASFAPRIIGGRSLPGFPATRRDCSSDWKVSVGQRITRNIEKAEEGTGLAVVTVIGTRSAESVTRQINTTARKETAHAIWSSPEGKLRLSPILDWSVEDVWTYLGEAAAGLHKSYSDFAELIDFYRASSGGECMIVSDMKQPGNSGGCGARSGCHICTVVKNDRSVEQMIASDPPRFRFLQPLLEFRNFLADTQYDWILRNFIGRTIDEDGFMAVKADQYSPHMCEKLLRYALAAQDDANRLGSPSRVSIVGLRELIAIDFYWSLRAWHPPFHALAIYFDHLAGNVQNAPVIKAVHPPSPAPVIGKLFVGREWDADASALQPPGLRDPVWEMFSDSCGPSLRTSPKGKVFMDIEEAPEFTVDEEGALMFLEFEAERMIRDHHAPQGDWTVAVSIYLRYGCVTLGKGMSSTVDDIIRRSQWLQRHDLHGQRGAKELAARCQSLASRQEVLFD